MKKIEMLFHSDPPPEFSTGMKYVLWEVTGPDGDISHDWGFADWQGFGWDGVPSPEGYTAKVIWWANTSNPHFLLDDTPAALIVPPTAFI